MSGQDYGRITGQHEQSCQQATMDLASAPTRIDCDWRHAPLLQDWIDSTFEHYDRIEILSRGEWRHQIDAEEEAEAGRKAWADAGFWDQMAEDAAQEEL